MESLSDRGWKPFYLGDIFSVQPGKSLPHNAGHGSTPYIAAAKTRNGLREFMDTTSHSEGNCLGVVRNGDGGVGYAFYHPYPACYSQDIAILRFSNPSLRVKNLYLFLALMIRVQRGKYNHGYKFNTLRIKRQRVMLPVDDSGQPDWEFMVGYVRSIGVPYPVVQKLTCEDHDDVNREWRPFLMGDLFTFHKGTSVTEDQKVRGNIPFVSAAKTGNGVTDFLSNKNKSYRQGVIGVNTVGDGGAGLAFYHPYHALFSQHVGCLSHSEDIPRDMRLGVGLFLSCCITMQESKYSHAYTYNDNRLKSQRIMLPVDSRGQPDWSFMASSIERLLHKGRKAISAHYSGNRTAACVALNKDISPFDWKPFYIRDIFTVRGGTDKPAKSFHEGVAPLISSSAFNNGITRFVSGEFQMSNCITVNRNGSVGVAHYHPYESVVTNDCRVLTFTDGNTMSRSVNLFFVACINAQRDKYNWGYKMGTRRILKQRIMLPVDPDGNIDYGLMEQYIGEALNISYDNIHSHL